METAHPTRCSRCGTVYVYAHPCYMPDTDAAEIEAIEDDRRIFQALCTERDRLAAVRARAPRSRLLATAHEHTERLVARYAGKLRELPGTPDGCDCVVLSSGTIHPCWNHEDEVTR